MAILTPLVRNIYSPSVVPKELGETLSFEKACHNLYKSRAACPGAHFRILSHHLPEYTFSPACLLKANGNRVLLFGLSREPSSGLGLES